MNKELLATSIIASAGLVLIFIFNPTFVYSYIIVVIGIIVSYVAAFNRMLTPAGIVLSIVPLIFINQSFITLLLGIGLGILSLVIPWVWELLLVILYAIFLLIPSTSSYVPYLNVYVFELAIFSSLGFANLRAATGKGYPAIVKVEGLPQTTWYAEVDGIFKAFNSQIVKGRDTIEIRLCPQYINNTYFIPQEVTVSAKHGEKKKVKFIPSNSPPPVDRFAHCYGYFNVKGLPANISWSVKVNNVMYFAKSTSDVIIVPMFNLNEAMWSVNDITLTNVVFRPVTYSGVIKRGGHVTIEYTSFVTQQIVPQTTQAKPVLPPLNKWDPNLWIGKELYGYKVISVLGTGGNGYVLKAEKDNQLYAIKIFSLSTTSNNQITMSVSSNFEQMFRESETLKSLSQNPKFVRIYGFYIDSNNIKSILKGNVEAYYNYPPAIIMEFMEGGTAAQLALNQNVTYSNYWPYIIKEIVKEIAIALDFLHSNNFVHLDVKPENIFFSKRLGNTPEEVYKNVISSIRLGDLGSAVKKGEKFYQATPSFCPPDQIEAVITGRGADPKMDIFALGMTAYTLLTLRNDNPISSYLNRAIDYYLSGNVGEAFKLVQSAKQIISTWRPTLPSNAPPDLVNVIIRSVSANPFDRPSASEIANMLK